MSFYTMYNDYMREQWKDANEMEFAVQGKKIKVYGRKPADREIPVIYLNTVHGEGSAVWDQCQRMECPAFILAEVSDIQWAHDMSPWQIPPITKEDTPCTGGARDYLSLLTGEILPL